MVTFKWPSLNNHPSNQPEHHVELHRNALKKNWHYNTLATWNDFCMDKNQRMQIKSS